MQKLWRRVADDLKKEIPRLDHGARLCTLHELCDRYQVSHITARRALLELSNEGLVERLQGKGTLVRRIHPDLSIVIVLNSALQAEQALQHPVVMRLHAGITAEASRHNITTMVVSEKYLSNTELLRRQNTGVLFVQFGDRGDLDLLAAAGIPCAVLHLPQKLEHATTVRVDMRRGAYLAVKHLTELGHRRIAFITGSLTSPRIMLRLSGYRKALREAGIRFDWGLLRETDGITAQSDGRALGELLNLKNRPTAVFAATDDRALHLLDFCAAKTIRVPGDISIVGYDNMPESLLHIPPLTTVDTKLERVGAEGVALLMNMVSDGKKRHRDILIRPELVIRETTGQNNKGGT